MNTMIEIVPVEVSSDAVEVCLPRLFPTMSKKDFLRIEHWCVSEGSIVKPGDYLLKLETPYGRVFLPTPPKITSPCYVAKIHKTMGMLTSLSENLVTLEPLKEYMTL